MWCTWTHDPTVPDCHGCAIVITDSWTMADGVMWFWLFLGPFYAAVRSVRSKKAKWRNSVETFMQPYRTWRPCLTRVALLWWQTRHNNASDSRYMKPWTRWTEARIWRNNNKFIYKISLQTYIPNSHFEIWAEKWFIHGPKRHNENQLLSLKHPCWLS